MYKKQSENWLSKWPQDHFHLWTLSFFSIFPSSKKTQKANLGFLKLKKLESKVKNLTLMYINQSVTTQTDMIRSF